MGSKNLKAVAVRGTGEVSVANPEEFMRLVEELLQKVMNDDGIKRYIKWGTTWIHVNNDNISANPVRNFQDGFWGPEKIEKTSAKELIGKYATRRLACFGCPVA